MTEKLIKNEQEAIDAIKSNYLTSGYYVLQEALDMGLNALEEIRQYSEIGTVAECREAREKQKAKNPDFWSNGYTDDGQLVYDMYDCPGRGESFEVDYDKYDYCPNCGQKLNWNGDFDHSSGESLKG